jgi:2-amino-4-hydroxy-6-hydroxymethyldihydropteridine diphosphokinase
MKVGIGLGSNIGDRLLNLQQAKRYLLSLSPEQWHVQSPAYETEPVGCPVGSGEFLNAVLEIEFTGAPMTLLEKLLAYEQAQGRDRSGDVNAPRPIDLDILYCGELAITEKDLVVPHPRMTERRFVLLPLSMIRPDLIVPGTGKSVQQLLQELPAGEGDVRVVQEDW